MARAKPRWSYKTGEKGRNRVRAYENEARAVIFAEFYENAPGTAEPRRMRISLGHRDRDAAKQYADDLAARFRRGEPAHRPKLTLATLFDMYEREVTPFKSAGVQWRRATCAPRAAARSHDAPRRGGNSCRLRARVNTGQRRKAPLTRGVLSAWYIRREKWAWVELNYRPHAYQACALTT